MDEIINSVTILHARVISFPVSDNGVCQLRQSISRFEEQELNVPLRSLNVVISDYWELLLAIQKIKFDLGLDEYKRVIPVVKPAEASVTRPDRVKTEQEVLEA